MVYGYATGPSTPIKDAHFREIIKTHIRIVGAIIKKYQWVHPEYHYLDLNAGPGIDEHGRVGSPVEFIAQADMSSCDYRAFLFEENHKTAYRLKNFINPKGQVIIGDHNETLPPLLPRIPKNAYGLIYADPTGKIPPYELIGKFSRYSKLIDSLIYVSSANIKRELFSPSCNSKLRLSEMIKKINKKFWIVREPKDKHQWTFLIGSNWDSFPVFNSLEFHRIDGEIGRAIMHRLDTTNKERKNGKS